jgi:pimeloyl-ACP methyl ester carboxylesterase
MKRLLALALGVACALAAPVSVAAAAAWPPVCEEGSLPSGDPRYPDDQLILTCFPPGFLWNGDLVVYAHGYVPPQEPLALPVDELTLEEGLTVADILLPLGFAFATTSYHKNGYAIEQGAADIAALVAFARTIAPRPVSRVLLIGGSEGALITTFLVESDPAGYDGGLALCGPLAGTPYQTAYFSDFRTVFDYFFPDVFSFGVVDVPPDAYLGWDQDLQQIEAALAGDPQATAQLFDVVGVGCDAGEEAGCAQDLLAYSVFGTNDTQEVAGGQPYGNLRRFYRGSDDDVALNLGVERYPSKPAAKAYVRSFYQPTGGLSRPLVLMHTTQDPIVPFRHVPIYQARVNRAGAEDNLSVYPVARFGHCAFETAELLGAFAALLLKTGGVVPAELTDELQSLPAARQ